MNSFMSVRIGAVALLVAVGIACATPISFTSGEGYTNDPLDGQPGSGSMWSVQSNSGYNIFNVVQGSADVHPDYLKVNLCYSSTPDVNIADYATKRMDPLTGDFVAGFSFMSSLSADNIGDETCIALGQTATSGWGVYLGFDKTATGSLDYHNGTDWVQITTGVAEREWHNIEISGNIDAGTYSVAIYREDQRVAGDDDSGLVGSGAAAFRDSPTMLQYVMLSNEGSTIDSGGYYHFYDDLYAVPEPASMAFLAIGALAMLRRRVA